jgi:hypothetical protein
MQPYPHFRSQVKNIANPSKLTLLGSEPRGKLNNSHHLPQYLVNRPQLGFHLNMTAFGNQRLLRSCVVEISQLVFRTVDVTILLQHNRGWEIVSIPREDPQNANCPCVNVISWR